MTTDDDTPGGSGGHVPLPPEHPLPTPELTDSDVDPSGADLSKDEGPVAPPDPGSTDAPSPGSRPPEDAGDVEGSNSAPGSTDWWRGGDVRDELRDTWRDEGGEAAAVAREVGYQLEQAAGTISDAVASTAYPAAAKRGLDIRWMRLSINIPAILLALLVTYGGRTATDRMVQVLIEDGPFAPLGWALLVVLVFGVVMVLPVGTPLAHALGHLVQWAAHGLVAAVRRGWQTPVIGYVLRLAVAVFGWSFLCAVLYVGGRSIIHWLTGA